MKDIVDVSDSIPTDVLARSYPNLEDISFPELDNKKVELLLGSNLHKAFLLQEQKVGGPDQPSGLHTALGWVIYGKDEGDHVTTTPSRFMVNFVNTVAENKQSCADLLQVMNGDFQDIEMDTGR